MERSIRTGDIYWLDDCPPLEGNVAKRRPVIVVSPKDRLRDEILVLVVAVSSTALATESDRIQLPSLADQPQTRTGLSRTCWAVPRWYLVVQRDHLRERVGYVQGALLRRIIAAVAKRMQE